MKEALASAYLENIKPRLADELKEVDVVNGGEGELEGEKRWGTSWFLQFRVLLERDVKERRHEAFSKIQIAEVIVVTFLAGTLCFRSGGHVPDQVGLLFYCMSFWAFFPLFQNIFTFPQERAMLAKERSLGMYRLSSYFAARLVGDLPVELIFPIFFMSIVYWMGHLKSTAANFFFTLAVLLFNVLVSGDLGLAIGALVLKVKTTTTVAAVLMMAFMLVGGFYVQKVPVFISWIKYLSVIFYTFRLALLSQFSPDDKYACGGGSMCSVADVPTVATVGLEGKWLATGMLLGMLVFYRLVAYLALMRVGVVGR